MPKFQGIQYQFEGMNIKFEYEGETVILPIKMGQSAYHVMSGYFDKIQRKTTTVERTRESYPGSHQALLILEAIQVAVAEHYELKSSHIKLLKTTLNYRMHAPVKQDIEILVSRLKPEQFETLAARDAVLAQIALVYDTHIAYKRNLEPKSIKTPARPMSSWYLPSRLFSTIIKN